MRVISHYEKNSMRKSYRTTIPLHVVIDNTTYHALDWSLTGLALKNFTNKYNPGDTIDASLVLPVGELSLSIPLQLKYEYREGDRFGFSFHSLSAKNRNVLRRFIDMAIEGDIENVDNILAIYYEPDTLPAAQKQLSLEKSEEEDLKRSFWRASWRYILFAFLLFALLGGLLFYHFRYLYEGIGIVTGNDTAIYPQRSAMIERLYVHRGMRVKKGDPLADLDSSSVEDQIELLEAQKRKYEHAYEEAYNRYKKNMPDQSRLLNLLQESVQKEKKNLQNAKAQYRARLITKNELKEVQKRYLQSKFKLENSKLQFKVMNQRYLNSEPLKPDTTDIDIKIAHLKKSLSSYRVQATVSGEIFDIYATEGQMVSQNRPLMTVWNEEAPLVEVEIPQRYLQTIVIGSEADLIDKSTQKHYRAKVIRIGTKPDAVNPENAVVWLSLEENQTVLQPFQRLDVLFKREF
jgi:multidrug resistance efflux pump